MGVFVLGLGVVAGQFEEFPLQYLQAFEAVIAFERVGGSEKLESGETDVAAGEGVGTFAAGDDYGLDGHAIGQVAARKIDNGRAGAAGDPIEIESVEGGVVAALAGVEGGVPSELLISRNLRWPQLVDKVEFGIGEDGFGGGIKLFTQMGNGVIGAA